MLRLSDHRTVRVCHCQLGRGSFLQTPF